MEFNNYIKEKLDKIEDSIDKVVRQLEILNNKTDKNCNDITRLDERTKDLNVVKIVSGVISGMIAIIVSGIMVLLGRVK